MQIACGRRRCTVVLENVRERHQCFLVNAALKAITCLDLSRDGRYIVTGEVCCSISVLSLSLSFSVSLCHIGEASAVLDPIYLVFRVGSHCVRVRAM